MSKSKAPEANGWHHHERVHIQAESGDMLLVQYVKRNKIKPLLYNSHGVSKWLRPMFPWAWLHRSEIMRDEELDAQLMRTWRVA